MKSTHDLKIAIIRVGYVGLVTGVCFSDFGYDVICVDKDALKNDKLDWTSGLAQNISCLVPDMEGHVFPETHERY